MAAISRTAQFARLHKILKKYYKPVAYDPNRTVLEQLAFACLLEDAHYERAEEAYAALTHTFFDWNEIRVTSVTELAEVMSMLPDPRTAGQRLKRVLQSVFEDTYSFDLEDKRKHNIGATVKWLEKLNGCTRFVIAFVVQMALGGHSIPVDSSTLKVLRLVNLITEKDEQAGVVPGLERAVSKSKGIEFGSLLHQLGADFAVNPFSPALREILLQICPDAQSRLPKRRAERPAQPAAETISQPAQAQATQSAEEKVEKPTRKKSDTAAAAPQQPTGDIRPKRSRGRKDKSKDEETTAAEPVEEGAAKSVTAELAKRRPR